MTAAGSTRRCYVVHARDGRILAIAPVEPPASAEGVRLGWRPVAGPDQLIAEIELPDDLATLSLSELLDGFEVDLSAAGGPAPCLRARRDRA
jgi:hypothetical protein